MGRGGAGAVAAEFRRGAPAPGGPVNGLSPTDGTTTPQDEGKHPAPAPAPDPARFAAETLGVQLWSKQLEVLEAVLQNRRVAVKSGNGLGKDFTAAVAVLWYLHLHDPGIVLSTAPTFRQVRHVLWRQIHALYRPVAGVLGGRMLDTRWELAEDRYALGLSATDAAQFQGFHNENMLIVVDEAEGVDEPIYEAVEAVMTSANPRLLLIGNPTTTSGGFYRAFHQESGIYETITISALESPNVAAGRVVVPGLTTANWVEERRELWREDSDLFRSRVLGEFPRRGEDNLIAVADIDAAYAPEEQSPGDPFGGLWDGAGAGRAESGGPVVIGVDVGRYGQSCSVILVRRGNAVEEMQTFRGINNAELAGRIVVAVRERRPSVVNIDEVGVGSGVVDTLHEQGVPVRGVIGGSGPVWREECANLRAEGYRTLAERFASGRIRIPHDAGLIAELNALRYKYNSRGLVLMESKEEMRRRGIPSPDKADALMLAFLDDSERW